jgi:hypothetical protein
LTPSCSTMMSLTFSSIGLSVIKVLRSRLVEAAGLKAAQQGWQVNELPILSINFRMNRSAQALAGVYFAFAWRKRE